MRRRREKKNNHFEKKQKLFPSRKRSKLRIYGDLSVSGSRECICQFCQGLVNNLRKYGSFDPFISYFAFTSYVMARLNQKFWPLIDDHDQFKRNRNEYGIQKNFRENWTWAWGLLDWNETECSATCGENRGWFLVKQ